LRDAERGGTVHHGVELTVVLIFCFALAVGAALTMLSERVKLPYTIALLGAGLASGVLLQFVPSHSTAALLSRGAEISPDLIIFVFLPVLVFESAFSLELHSFRKNLGAVLVLAGPTLVLSTVAVAGLTVALTAGGWGWSWLVALVFGALISATDPIAVVALLRSLGAPKRLALLIEGESLLNDGTAIVVFSLLLAMLTGGATLDVPMALGQLLWVAGGGFVVGLVLAGLVSLWLSRTFNQPMVEITLTLMLAYLAMAISEAVLHVSGVIAVVTAGLWMSGPGRVHISPEVRHFLHRFWQMLSHLANTLIFFLVGLVIASHLRSITVRGLVLTGAVFIGIVVLRFALMALARPFMNRLADPLTHRETALMAWGGLRGAVSLALALVVSQHPKVDPETGRQVLLLTGGVVLLTIVVNGSTMGWLLKRLGYGKPPASDRLAQHATLRTVLERVREHVDAVSDARDLQTVRWRDVHDELTRDGALLDDRIDRTREELREASPAERMRGYWRQVLSVERAAYWRAFSRGTLGARATEILDHEIDAQLDRLTAGESQPPTRRVHQLPGWLRTVSGWLQRLGRGFTGAQLRLLTLRYDLYRGEQLAAEHVLEQLDTIVEEGAENEQALREELSSVYQGYRHGAKERLEDLRANLPELTVAIETRLAHRIRLNFERESYQNLAKQGVVDPDAAEAALRSVEERMKKLLQTPQKIELPETAELCRNAPMFEHLDDEAIAWLADATVERVWPAGETLFEQGDRGDSTFIIARGAIGVLVAGDGDERPRMVDVLGGGDIVGEMALLTGAPRNATVSALTTVTLGEISRSDFNALTEAHPRLGEAVWDGFVARTFDNHVRKLPRYAALGRDERLAWIAAGAAEQLDAGGQTMVGAQSMAFIALGSVVTDDGIHVPAPALLRGDIALRAEESTRLIIVPLTFAALPVLEPSAEHAA
jgi:Na+/H+ antiporter